MKNLLEGKVALVTGGTRGIGKAIAKRFIESGATVVIVGTNDKLGQEVVEEFMPLLRDQQTSLFIKLDVSKTTDVDLAIKDILTQLGKIDILVNNAGITKDNLLLKMSEEEWDDVLNVNLKSVYNTSRAVIRSMIKARQ
jgi:3-oxoacyl-[acyl-carrier protein] reductase